MIIEWQSAPTPIEGLLEIGRVVDPPITLPTTLDPEFMEKTQHELAVRGWLGEPSADTFVSYDFIAPDKRSTLPRRPGRIEVGTSSPWHHDGKFVSAGVIMVGCHDPAFGTVFSGRPNVLPYEARFQGEPWTLYSPERFMIHRGPEVILPYRALYRWGMSFCQPRT
jgi:hypothetical protein